MKFRLKQFVEQDTDLIYRDFKKSRRNLILIYLSIILTVILLFSFLLFFQIKDEFDDSPKEIVVSEQEAIDIAIREYPNLEITDREYETKGGQVYFTTEFEGDIDVKVNLFDGSVLKDEDTQEMSLLALLSNDLDQILFWIGLLVFILASLLSIFIANKTLSPITKNIKKQKQFVSDTAHELRNPLSAMYSALEAEIRRPEQVVSKDILKDLLKETKRLINTSESLLDFEKSQSRTDGDISSVGDVLSDIEKRLFKLIKDKNLFLEKNIENEDIKISKNDLEKILYNLIHNSIKFTNFGGTITVIWKNNTLTISDTGIGIKREDLKKIFDRFYKVDKSRNLNNGGSGLGLSLVEEIVYRNKGKIKVESKEGQGTVFEIKF
jgi:signal transduction histidine kinase